MRACSGTLGLRGWPAVTEEAIIARMFLLIAYVNGFTCVTSRLQDPSES